MNQGNDQRSQAILAALLSPSEPWLPELTESLVASGWEALGKDIGISPSTYSSANVMRRSHETPDPTTLIPIHIKERGSFASIEFLDDEVEEHFSAADYRFPIYREVSDTAIAKSLSHAFELIAFVPTLHNSVALLVKSVHILESKAKDCDISFSDPALPFSIFISAPTEDSPNIAFRLAEATIHEAMHLQLSLLERLTPIAPAEGSKHYSPWKKSDRAAGGLLHALYVFTVIDSWLNELPFASNQYLLMRRTEIAQQVAQIEGFHYADLTYAGDLLRRHLFSLHRL